ncbi:MAG: hypothetical protein AAGB93_10630 [Planctomycetota bacterium]
MPSPEPTEELQARREAMLTELHDRIGRTRDGGPSPHRRRAPSLSGVRLRTLLLPAFAIVLLVQLGSRAGAPLGVEAAFTPGAGTSFAGPRIFERPADASPGAPVRIEPGDVVGARSGATSVLAVGRGRLRLDPGARAVLASLMPPRVRLVGGSGVAEGRLRVVTAHGIVDVEDGSARLELGPEGLDVLLLDGAGRLIAPDATTDLAPGQRASAR